MSANMNLQKAYFVLSEKIIAQGFFNPEVNWKGFREPVFPIDECERLIKLLESQDDVEYIFKRNSDDSGYLLTDINSDERNVIEVDDSTVIFNGEIIPVNGLAEGWCWEELSEDRYKEWNLLIKEGEVISTVEHLHKS